MVLKSKAALTQGYVKLPWGREHMANAFSIVSSSEQDENCSSEGKFHLRCQVLLRLGIHVFLLPGWRQQAAEAWGWWGAALHQARPVVRPRTMGWSLQNERRETGQGVKLKEIAATVTSCHLPGAAGRGSRWVRQIWTVVLQCKGAKSGRSPKKWEWGQHATKKSIMCIFCAHILCINEWTVICYRKEGKLHPRDLQTTMSYRFNYILLLVNNLQWLISYSWTTGMCFCDGNYFDHSYKC